MVSFVVLQNLHGGGTIWDWNHGHFINRNILFVEIKKRLVVKCNNFVFQTCICRRLMSLSGGNEFPRIV
ncbi:hypothetical protein GOP47_0004818 [Adiantum capillus-veneris]|uniref:Uncharacterized protein n=1 Tax=Adiantum capillus-veneris TaxID=13818 RepID=A0A9D4V4D3_ADICA|nr:hypothetical protein GOP47_0004818 [Adiantum capillus-veneris]